MTDHKPNTPSAQNTSDTKLQRALWLKENAEAFKAQAQWHEENEHPLADIIVRADTTTSRI